jgi:hypothetical protein
MPRLSIIRVHGERNYFRNRQSLFYIFRGCVQGSVVPKISTANTIEKANLCARLRQAFYPYFNK